jgi:hypothetical protein
VAGPDDQMCQTLADRVDYDIPQLAEGIASLAAVRLSASDSPFVYTSSRVSRSMSASSTSHTKSSK